VSARSTPKSKKRLRTVILTWEFPPRVVGDLAWRVKWEVDRIRESGLAIEVVTISDSGYSVEEQSGLFRVTRVTSPVHPQSTIITWLAAINVEAARVVSDIYNSTQETLVLHSHDWHIAPAASTLKQSHNVTWIITVHSLEIHRSLNPNTPLSLCIRTIEREMVRECDRVIVGSDWMRSEVVRELGGDPERISVLSTGSSTWSKEIVNIYRSLVKAR
jgi:hypothetical protein